MKKLLMVVLLFSAGISKAQNIVPNPGFEILDSICPISYFISYSYLWESANTATPDIFDTCQGIPQNNSGYQYAHSGKGMAGIVTKGPANYREYLEIKLDSALKDAHDYCVEFWISMGEYSQLATHPPQVYFSDTLITNPTQNVMYFTPQFMDTTMIITDTANWVQVTGSFTSYCNCQYMLIGNFYDDANTDTVQIQSSYLSAYYYIDDVSVTECNPAGIRNNFTAQALMLFPNPATDALTVKGLQGKHTELCIYSMTGQLMRTMYANTSELQIDMEDLPDGVYFMQLKDEYSIQVKRFVKH